MNRWLVYARERFPLAQNGALIAAFSASAIAFSALVRGAGHFPAWYLLAAGFASSFLMFALLRIADEFKDADDDARWRPYRPVPRGLVTLQQLAVAGATCMGLQVAIALAVNVRLVPELLVVWAWFALMSKEFFAREWLRAHPLVYIASHMVIVPLIDWYVSSFDWLVAGVPAPSALGWFLAVTFLNGLVVEVGRKIRAPQDEEPGVETYTALWGRAGATAVWAGAIACNVALATVAAAHAGFGRVDVIVFGALALAAAACALAFLRSQRAGSGRRIEQMTGAWTLGSYLFLGIVPLGVHVLQ
ncbi:MAG: UbiA family prenyltransferase [Candidatus Eremiobacteraeota bacterium]|nr:UbiA family prenyltransferase [Candidatus Eremiobacteraeota bacterium]